MGTRALFIPINEWGEEICVIYTQFDGYPSGLPLLVARFLSKRRLVNAIPAGKDFEVINGMNDLVAQVVTLLKIAITHSCHSLSDIRRSSDVPITAGTIYVMPPGTRNIWEEYRYYIYPDDRYAELCKKEKELLDKYEKVQDDREKARAVANMLRKITLNVINDSFGFKIKAVSVWSDREEVIFEGSPDDFVKKFSVE